MDKTPRHTPAFYAALTATIASPDICSCGYFGFGDFHVLEIMALEQVRRAKALAISPKDAFPLSSHCDFPHDPMQWGAHITYYSEGISNAADLFINDHEASNTVRRFLTHRPMSTRVVFSSVSQTLGVPPRLSTLKQGYLTYSVNAADYRIVPVRSAL